MAYMNANSNCSHVKSLNNDREGFIFRGSCRFIIHCENQLLNLGFSTAKVGIIFEIHNNYRTFVFPVHSKFFILDNFPVATGLCLRAGRESSLQFGCKG